MYNERTFCVCDMYVNAEVAGICQVHFTIDSGKQGQTCIIRVNLEKTLPYIKSKLSP